MWRRKGQEETVKLLLEHGAKAVLNDRNKRGLNAFGEALAGGHTRVADILVKVGKLSIQTCIAGQWPGIP